MIFINFLEGKKSNKQRWQRLRSGVRQPDVLREIAGGARHDHHLV